LSLQRRCLSTGAEIEQDEALESGQDAFDSALENTLVRWGINVSADRLDRLRTHFDTVIDANRTMNLTRITEPVEAAVKHYADSLALLPWVEERGLEVESVLDIGTGAGFPAMPLAVMRPDWNVTAIDSTAKKVRFLTGAAEVFGIENLRVEHAHSAHWKPGRTFDLIVSRALARLPSYLEQAAPLASPGGWIVAYKTPELDSAEAAPATAVLKKLHLSAEPPHLYDLDLESDTLHRALYIYRKTI
jgi:16S rRNA (guanine527-N7)-methyltransferase